MSRFGRSYLTRFAFRKIPTATGPVTHEGAAISAITFGVAADAAVTYAAAVTTSVTFGVSADGLRNVTGSATTSITFGVAADGLRNVTGSAVTAITFGVSADGQATYAAASVSSITFGVAADGSVISGGGTTHEGAAVIGVTFTVSAAGSLATLIFRTPTVADRRPYEIGPEKFWEFSRSANMFARHFAPGLRGKNVFKKLDGTFVEDRQPSASELDITYYGGKNNRITSGDEYDDLVAAGYGSYISWE